MHWQTHTVFNQPAPLSNSNLFLSDCALRDAVAREGAEWDVDLLASIGQQLGTAESLELGRLANVNPPELLRYDATGERLDDVRFHPAWHLLMQGLCANRVHNLAWEEEARKGSFVARAARFVLHAQVEAGTLCPVTMTFAATPLLLQSLPKPFHDWLTPLMSDRYDPHLAPGAQKRGLLIGMGMTEKQGGSDVLSNTTKAEKCSDGSYRLVGHKWFFSVPQSDAHLVLAQAKGGLSCFFVPRFLPDGQRNAVRLERLKDKLGNRSNASSEAEFLDASGWLLGEEGEGVRQILKMGGLTRFDCALGSHGLMRRALSVALYHAHQRQTFGKNLIDQPLMRDVLSRMALVLEGHTALLFRLARAWDNRTTRRRPHGRGYSLRRQNTASAKRAYRLWQRQWRCWAAQAIAKRVSFRGCTVKCPSTASGKALAILCAWMYCAYWRSSRVFSTCSPMISRRSKARTGISIAAGGSYSRSCVNRRKRRAGRSRGTSFYSGPEVRCCGTHRRPWRRRGAA